MSRFIHSLESRRLLSVTKATLVADAALIAADGTAVKAYLKTSAATVAADMKAIQTDLKALPKTNAPLFKTLKADEAKILAVIKKDVNALIGPATALARRSAADGAALITKSSTAVEARVAADVTALGTVTSAPLAKLEADENASPVETDLQAIANANPTDSTLAADVAKQQTDFQNSGATFNAAAMKVQTDVGTLASDLENSVPGSGGSGGTGGSKIPNLVGRFTGSANVTVGQDSGSVTQLAFDITTEGSAGSFSGTGKTTDHGGTHSNTISGTVTANGTFNATVTDTSNGNVTTLTGTVSGNSISGTFNGGGDTGTFKMTK